MKLYNIFCSDLYNTSRKFIFTIEAPNQDDAMTYILNKPVVFEKIEPFVDNVIYVDFKLKKRIIKEGKVA